MATLLQVMKTIQDSMETMWRHSDPDKYLQFRSFIMGTKSQPMFPNGVVYEGVADQATFFRGESGANDSMIPTMDNLLQLTSVMPNNPLTDILKDFRSYRPVHHSQWLAHVEDEARRVNVRRFAQAESNSAVLYLALLDQVREFRDRHWKFAKEYIIKHTLHPVGTGGSPIVRWLPNQLQVVLDQMTETSKLINRDELTAANRVMANDLTRRGAVQARILKREVKSLEAKFSTNADHRASNSRLNVGQQTRPLDMPIPGHTTGSHDQREGGIR
jgi:indoleamine 2,3-dioxygenase